MINLRGLPLFLLWLLPTYSWTKNNKPKSWYCLIRGQKEQEGKQNTVRVLFSRFGQGINESKYAKIKNTSTLSRYNGYKDHYSSLPYKWPSGILEQYFMFHTFAHSKGNEMQEPCVPMDSFSLKISIIYLMQDCSRPMPAKWLCSSNSSNFG